MHHSWSYRTGISEKEHHIFQEAIGHNVHHYHPISVAHRDAMRYRFIANTVISPKFPTNFMVIEVYKPPNGRAYVTRKSPLNTDI